MTESASATALSPEVREQVDLTIEHVNGNHADTVLFIARHHGSVPNATDAEAIDVDSEGLDVRVVVDGETTTTRLPFTNPVTTAPEVQGEVLGMISTARQTVGDAEPLTSLEEELATTGNLLTRVTQVAEVSELSPNLRRIILQGGLEDWVSLGADDFAFLFVPRSADDTSITEDFTMAAWQEMAEDEQPFGAYYTIRRHDPETNSIELWAVLHGHDHGVGGWAAGAQPGDTVALWGPRRFFRQGEDPAAHHVFVADESGLAAVGAVIDTLDQETPVTVIAETVDADHEITITDRPGVTLTWLHRGDDPPGRSAGFVDHVKALDLHPDTTVAFGAGESRQVTAVRGYLRREIGVPADRVFLTGYWRL
ncbi:MAG: SIP domain-containing protein [Actinomycetota bacterium]